MSTRGKDRGGVERTPTALDAGQPDWLPEMQKPRLAQHQAMESQPLQTG